MSGMSNFTKSRNPYIHYNFENATDIDYSAFSKDAQRKKIEAGRAMIMKNMKSNFGAIAKAQNITLKKYLGEMQKFLTEEMKDTQEVLTSGFNIGTTMEPIVAASIGYVNKDKGDMQRRAKELAQDTDKLQKFIDYAEKALATVTEQIAPGGQKMIQEAVDYMIQSAAQRGGGSPIDKGDNELITEYINGRLNQLETKTLVKINPQYKDSTNRLEKEVLRVKSYVEMMKKFLDKDAKPKSQSEVSLLQYIPTNINLAVSRIGGIVGELVVQQAINTSEEAVMKGLEAAVLSTGTNPLSKKVTFERDYAKRGGTKIQTTNTEDVTITWTHTDESSNAQVSVTAPGISVKRTMLPPGLGPDQSKEIKLKTGNTLGLNFVRGDIMQYEYSILNIAASGKRAGSNYTGSLQDFQNAFKFIAASNLANALVGTMNSGDFGFFFVLNKKVYQATDIFDKILETKPGFSYGYADGLKVMEPKYPAKEAWDLNKFPGKDIKQRAENRSDAMYADYMRETFNTVLKIKGREFVGS